MLYTKFIPYIGRGRIPVPLTLCHQVTKQVTVTIIHCHALLPHHLGAPSSLENEQNIYRITLRETILTDTTTFTRDRRDRSYAR